jgi:non-homologous end joining protein Ku
MGRIMATSVWKGYLSFGLVTFPVRLRPAARAEHVDERSKGRKITAAAPSRKAPMIDLMEALKMSLKSSGTESRASTKSRGSKDAPASGKAPRKRKIA